MGIARAGEPRFYCLSSWPRPEGGDGKGAGKPTGPSVAGELNFSLLAAFSRSA